MTVDELKAEADKLGYKLIEKKEHVPLLACPVCGAKKTRTAYHLNTQRRACAKCGWSGYYSNTMGGLNEEWNNAVKRNMEEQDETD